MRLHSTQVAELRRRIAHAQQYAQSDSGPGNSEEVNNLRNSVLILTNTLDELVRTLEYQEEEKKSLFELIFGKR